MSEITINVVNKKNHKPTKHDFYCGRPSILGNPFSHLPKSAAEYKVKTREDAIAQYRIHIEYQLIGEPAYIKEFERILAHLRQHKIVNLVCWCSPLSCHGDVLKAKLLFELNK